jgi:hypothetical protein
MHPERPIRAGAVIPKIDVPSPLKAGGVGKKVISPICSDDPLKNAGFLRFFGLAFPYNLLQPVRGQNYNPFEN